MSIGFACHSGGGFQQLEILSIASRIELTSAGPASARSAQASIVAATAYATRLRDRLTRPHLMSEATCTFTILSGSVTAPLEEPADAFFNLSTTSIPETTSPTTVYWPFRLAASPNMKKNWEFAVSTLSPRRAIPTMPRLNGTLENSALRLGYFEPPVPLKFLPSPVCAMKPSITRWNGTLL